MNTSLNNKRIAKNTACLYIRMFISMAISFFTAGIVLNTLGVVDYGIFNVVGGLVTMFTIVSNSLSAASSRFIAFELGKENGFPRNVFSTSIHIHLGLAVLMVILLETVGLWFLSSKLVIPPDRMLAAHWVFQCSVLSMTCNLIGIPYIADIMANEHMDAFAYIGIFESALRLLILFLLMMGDMDKLILYGILQFFVALLIQIIYIIYCKHHFNEASINWVINRNLVKKMASFSGWNFIGSSSALIRDQGVNMILNMFCGPAINAARGIGISVNNIISGFGTNLLGAINPQITKSYACGNIQYAFLLVRNASRYAFLLLFFIVYPIMVRTELLLQIWLRNVPEYAVVFTQLTLCFSLIEIISNPLITLVLATGNIKWYQIIVGGAQLLNLPLSFLCLKSGFPPEITVCVAIIIGIVCLFLRLIILQRIINLSAWTFIKTSAGKALLIVGTAWSFYLFTNSFWECSILQSFIYMIVCTIFNGAIICIIGLTKNERKLLYYYITQRMRKDNENRHTYI